MSWTAVETDLVAWLTQILDAKEKRALAVTAAWPAEASKVYDEVYKLEIPTHDEQDADEWDVRVRREEAQFIADNGPAAVLADIAAKRAIIALHKVDNETGVRLCAVCGCPDDWPIQAPCETLRLLASVYAARPGYQGEWRP